MAADQDREQLGPGRESREHLADSPGSCSRSHTVDLFPSVRLLSLGSLGNLVHVCLHIQPRLDTMSGVSRQFDHIQVVQHKYSHSFSQGLPITGSQRNKSRNSDGITFSPIRLWNSPQDKSQCSYRLNYSDPA